MDKLAQQSESVIDNYLVSRNQVGGKLALATVTASAMGGWTLFNPPEAGAALGGITAVLGYCLGTAMAVFTFAFVGPRLRQIMPWGSSLNEYVRNRFTQQPHHRRIASLLYWLVVAVMLLYMFVYLTAELTVIIQVLKQQLSWSALETSLAVMAVIFLYTAIGGLRATILTDAVQFMLIVPLLVVCFSTTAWALGGLGSAFEPVLENSPELLSLGNIGGLRFGATLLIAITAAEIFNQANWQRVYACRDEQTVRRSFSGSALVILPLIFIAGLLGLMAAGKNFQTSTAFFDLLASLSVPGWVQFAIIMLALALVMSSLDSLLNAITAVLTLDFLRLTRKLGDRDESQALIVARAITIAIGVLAIQIATEGHSVIFLFFIADLLCAALVFPVIFSFYNRHQSALNAFWSSIVGLALGVLFFPKPDFSPLFNVPGGGDLLNSFTVALLASAGLTLFWTKVDKNNKNSGVAGFSYRELRGMRKSSTDSVESATLGAAES